MMKKYKKFNPDFPERMSSIFSFLSLPIYQFIHSYDIREKEYYNNKKCIKDWNSEMKMKAI